MASITPILRKKSNKQGLFPIYLRITKERKSTFINLNHYIAKEHWDEKLKRVKKSHPNSVRLNNLISQKVAEAGKQVIDMDASDKVVSVKALRKKIINKENDFFQIAQEYLDNLERLEKYNQLSADKPRITHFRDFLNCNKFPINQIDTPLLRAFQSFLKVERGVSDRTVMNHLIVIRTIYNLAIRDGIVDQKNYPFGKNKIQIKFPETMKIGLEQEEVLAIENLDLKTGSNEWHTRNIWLFSFYLAGIRVADVLETRWEDIQDGRLRYRMNKNKKIVSLKIPDKVLSILSHYQRDKYANRGFVFPELSKVDRENPKEILKAIRNANRKLNKYLKRIAKLSGIQKSLTMHISRHTFGNISGDKISVQMLQKLYRHSSITTTVSYQANFINKDIDDALEAVVGF